jgi:hypothetical protein
MKPEVVEVSVINLMGGHSVIIARVRYEGEVLEVVFTGKRDGAPRVQVVVEGTHVPVPFPGRFGKEFNEEWVRAYFAKEIKDKED